MKWIHPPIIKIYEALSAVVDNRVETEGSIGKVYSSSRNKYYNVDYDEEMQAIMCNDNASFWNGTLGYPAIAFLMQTGVLPYDETIGALLKNIAWKDINQKFKNDYEKTLEYILSSKTDDEKKKINDFVTTVDQEIKNLDLNLLGKKTKPPHGY